MLQSLKKFGNSSLIISKSNSSESTLLDSPTVSSVLTPVACALGAVGGAATTTASAAATSETSPSSSSSKCETTTTRDDVAERTETTITINNLPTTPNSTTSTAPLLSFPNSPLPPDDDNIDVNMPTKTTTTKTGATKLLPIVITTAEIIDENRYAILGKTISSEDFNIDDLPLIPMDKHNNHHQRQQQQQQQQQQTLQNNTDSSSDVHLLLNSSAGTTNSTVSTLSTSMPTASSEVDNGAGGDGVHVVSTLPSKHIPHKNHNNNHHQQHHQQQQQQDDINSIESIADIENPKVKEVSIPTVADVEWIDELIHEENSKEMLHKNKRKKKKKQYETKELDQMDGITTNKQLQIQQKSHNDERDDEEDEKMVKCLYYTLMCCDCTIS